MPIDPRIPDDHRLYPSAVELARAIVAAARGATVGELRQAERERKPREAPRGEWLTEGE